MRVSRLAMSAVIAAALSGCATITETIDAVGAGIGEALESAGTAPTVFSETPGGAGTGTQGPKIVKDLEAALAVPVPGRDQAAVALIQSAPDKAHPELTRYLEANADILPPLLVYELAGRTYAMDRWKGVFWYAVARLRLDYDLHRCTDSSLLPQFDAADRLVGGPLMQIEIDPKTAYATALAALSWERDKPAHRYSILPLCLSGREAVQTFGIDGVKAKKEKNGQILAVGPDGAPIGSSRWIVPQDDHRALLDAARERARAWAEALLERPGGLPQAWDD